MESLVNSHFWSGKKVFLTGHTGFKGSWMSLWLTQFGANVTGYALAAPTQPSLFEEAQVAKIIDSRIGDIRNLENLKKIVQEVKPEIVIHMAAQPLVRYSYHNPVETYMTNVMGTVHLFEASRASGSVRAVLNVTSDKCYENAERASGYCEDEAMGGHDPYSNSKGCAELVTTAYRKSFFEKEGIYLASARAGNVIGGGDWAQDRLVPDIVRSVLDHKVLHIRNPNSLRPWQHVLEPVGGYLRLAEKLFTDGKNFSEGFNFGPKAEESCDVVNIIKIMNSYWNNQIKFEILKSESHLHEAQLLKLDCTKAAAKLNWQPQWNINQALEKTVHWNVERLAKKSVQHLCLQQINEYLRV